MTTLKDDPSRHVTFVVISRSGSGEQWTLIDQFNGTADDSVGWMERLVRTLPPGVEVRVVSAELGLAIEPFAFMSPPKD